MSTSDDDLLVACMYLTFYSNALFLFFLFIRFHFVISVDNTNTYLHIMIEDEFQYCISINNWVVICFLRAQTYITLMLLNKKEPHAASCACLEKNNVKPTYYGKSFIFS